MRKKFLLAGMVLAMSATALTACGNNKEDYLNDLQEINDFGVAMQEMEEISDYADAIAEMEVKTAEGKVIKEDMEEMGDYLEQLNDMMEDLENYDEEAATELSDKLTELQEKVEEHAEDFKEAAEKSGVEEEDIEEMDLAF